MKDYNNLVKEFPNIFRSDKTIQESLIPYFNIECGIGWYDLIYNASKEISEYCFEQDITDVYVVQIKSKFASLRYYTNYTTDEIDKIIYEAEHFSEITCERCGEPGTISDKGWITCLCNKCREENTK